MSWRITSPDDYKKSRQESLENPEKFWGEIAKTFEWEKTWDEVCSGDFDKVDMKWFEGGKLNITTNCLDRHLENKGDKDALVFIANDPKAKPEKFSFKELHQKVCRASKMLSDLGVKKGDRVCLYMGMVPELLVSVLACARIGAIHSVVFGGFSAKALRDRINDCGCKFLITSDGSFRGSKIIDLKAIADDALSEKTTIEKVVVHRRIGKETPMTDGRDHWWHELYSDEDVDFPAETVASEDPLFILYTSGSTGKPKGVVHTTAGYMVWANYTFQNVFQVDDDSLYWCTADIGWITGHSYLTYGPLLNGSTTVMFEGVPTYPDAGRFWQEVERLKITHFYTAPTAIRALMAQGDEHVTKYDLSSLKVLGTVGEPINEEAWNWYNEKVGAGKTPIVDTWWQTETGGIMISSLGGVTPSRPTFATLPMPGIEPALVDNEGKVIKDDAAEGNLCILRPWPGIARTVYGDHDRFIQTYFSTYPGKYFTGDGAKRAKDGDYRITGRVDDVMNVSGHRIGTAEVEDALDLHDNVVEAAVVGYPHDIKGQGIFAYICLSHSVDNEETFEKELNDLITKEIGPIAKPDRVVIVPGLPKTRSGKIMRRILRKLAEGEPDKLGDTSTLLNPEIVEEIKSKVL